jgi:hypothetical protein
LHNEGGFFSFVVTRRRDKKKLYIEY